MQKLVASWMGLEQFRLFRPFLMVFIETTYND